ncbi:MAG: MMPL family transporter [Acidimicrobiales bacterium]
MNRIFTAIGAFSVKFRYFIIVGWLVLVVASVSFFPSLSSVVKNNNSDFLPKNSPSIQAANLAKVFQNTNDSTVIVVAYRPGTALTAADTTAISTLANDLRKVPTVVRSTVAGTSKNQEAEQIEILSSTSTFSNSGTKTLVGNIQAELARVHLPQGLQVHTAGQIPTAVEAAATNGGNVNSTQSYTILFILLILLLVFRSILAPLITLVPALLVVVGGTPLIARLSTALNFQVSSITQLLLIVLVLGAGTDYGLFLVFRVREELRNGRSGKDAVRFSVSKVGESITFSAFTVIAALLSLITATFGFYKGLGYPLAIAIFLMLLAGITLQPALLSIFGRAAFWPSKPHKQSGPKVGLWGKVAGRVVQRPVITLTAGILVFGALALASLGNKPSGFTSTTTVPKTSDVGLGNAALSKYFATGSFNPTQFIFKYQGSVWNHLPEIAQLESALSKSSQLTHVTGPFDPFGTPLSVTEVTTLHNELGYPGRLPAVEPTNLTLPAPVYLTYRSIGQFVAKDGHTIFFNAALKAGDPGSTAALNAVPGLRTFTTHVQHLYGASKSAVAGEAPAAYDISSSSNSDLLHIVPLVIVIIALLLAIVLRSLIAPIYLVISVLLSYLAALGVDVLYFMNYKGDQGLSFILPFMLFLFLLALGEDYNILVMTRIREEAHGLPLKEAVTKALGSTGATVTSAGLVLAATFFVLGFAGGSGNPQVQQIGYGLGLGIVMDTFLVRTLLVPSAVVLLGRWNWWPSKLHDLHKEFEEAERQGPASEPDQTPVTV